jgi:hypothetical protein
VPINPKFNLTEWWKIEEGEKLSKPFDVGEELVAGLLHALAMVSTLFYRLSLKSTGDTEASVDLHTRTINGFKRALHQHQEIEGHIKLLKSFLAAEYERCFDETDSPDNEEALQEA